MSYSGPISALLKAKPGVLWTISPDQTVFEAIQTMAEKNVGALLVMQGSELLGILSERDYTRKVILMGRSSKEAKAREIMTSPVVSVTPEMGLDEAMRIMTARHIRHLPVMDRERVVGMLSVGDVLKSQISAQHSQINQLEGYISGSYPG